MTSPIKHTAQAFRKQDGATLIELIIVMLVVGLLFTAISGILRIESRSFVLLFDRNITVSEIRHVLKKMKSDILQASRSSILRMERDRLEFRDTKHKIVRYAFRNHSLYYNNNELLSGIVNFTFSFLNDKKQVIKKSEDLKIIRIQMQVQRPEQKFRFGESIYVRN